MLIITDSLSKLSFSQLMEVYIEGNRENGEENYPDCSAAEQLLYAEQDFYNYLRSVFFQQRGSFYAIWLDDGCYKAALRVEPYHDGYILCGLETRPEARRQGYATILITEVIKFLSKKSPGVLYSHISKKNTASLKAHYKCGFEKILEHAIYTDGSVITSSYTVVIRY